MYIGNDLQIAHPSYKIIDDISSGFNGSTTSFALQVSGATPVPFPISTQQVMISVNGVVQEPDPTGSAGFKLLGSNIVFSSAPANGHAFFGVINAGADYVTAGSEFPDGSATAPSFTFQDDQDTGWFRSGSGSVGYSANGAQTLTFDGNGLTVTGDASFVGDSSKNLLWDKSDGALEFADNAKAVFGTNSDFQIYHDGTNNYIKHVTTGAVYFETTTNLNFRVNSNENAIVATANGAVELFHDNAKKLETTAGGIAMSGVENAGAQIKVGIGNDIQIEHDGSNSYFSNTTGNLSVQSDDLRLTSKTGGESYLKGVVNGAVELYYNNEKTFETLQNGVRILASEGNYAYLHLWEDEGDDNADKWRMEVAGGSFKLANYSTGSWVNGLTLDGSNNATFVGNIATTNDGSSSLALKLQSGATWGIRSNPTSGTNAYGLDIYKGSGGTDVKFKIDQNGAATFASSVSDSKGNLRSVPVNSQGSTYTLVAADAGKAVALNFTNGGCTINTSIFAAGDVVTIINASTTDKTITKGSGLNLYNTADGTDANRTLSARGMATLIFVSHDGAYISGAGLS